LQATYQVGPADFWSNNNACLTYLLT